MDAAVQAKADPEGLRSSISGESARPGSHYVSKKRLLRGSSN